MKAIVLIVEDDDKMVASLKAALADNNELEVRNCSFGDAPEWVRHALPDMVILDLFLDSVGNGDPAAKPTWDLVLKDHFCPVVIHTAHDEEEYRDFRHPYVRFERKNAASIAKVAGHVAGFRPQMLAFRSLRLDLTRRAGEALRETSMLLSESGSLTPDQEKVVLRAARRRVAASIDDAETHEFGWERYVLPPVSKTLMMGDVLLERGKPDNDPGSFAFVLTPSCDLVPGQKGADVHALIASCVSFDEFKTAAGLDKATPATIRKSLPKFLSRDQVGGLVPVPGLPTVFPTMAVDLRKLRIVRVADISLTDTDLPFRRRASLDSPFREKLMWGYVQIAGRPATPDLNPAKLLDEVAPLPAVPAPAK